MTQPPARSLASRLRKAIAFVAIVWGVAATYVAIEVVSLSGMDLALSYPAVFGDIALSRAVTESTSCAVPQGRAGEPPPRAVALRDARVGAWLLGLNLGRDAVFRQYVDPASEPFVELVSAREALAARLGVPAPPAFEAAQIANANTEFVAFVEHDDSETATRLARVYSPEACELFKLGALWGYSEVVRPALPGERAVFAMEIRHHSRRAGVPEPLWEPMLQRLPSNASREEVTGQMAALTEGVTIYLTRLD